MRAWEWLPEEGASGSEDEVALLPLAPAKRRRLETPRSAGRATPAREAPAAADKPLIAPAKALAPAETEERPARAPEPAAPSLAVSRRAAAALRERIARMRGGSAQNAVQGADSANSSGRGAAVPAEKGSVPVPAPGGLGLSRAPQGRPVQQSIQSFATAPSNGAAQPGGDRGNGLQHAAPDAVPPAAAPPAPAPAAPKAGAMGAISRFSAPRNGHGDVRAAPPAPAPSARGGSRGGRGRRGRGAGVRRGRSCGDKPILRGRRVWQQRVDKALLEALRREHYASFVRVQAVGGGGGDACAPFRVPMVMRQDPVQFTRALVAAAVGAPPSRVRLSFGGKVMFDTKVVAAAGEASGEEDASLMDYGVAHAATLQCTVLSEGGGRSWRGDECGSGEADAGSVRALLGEEGWREAVAEGRRLASAFAAARSPSARVRTPLMVAPASAAPATAAEARSPPASLHVTLPGRSVADPPNSGDGVGDPAWRAGVRCRWARTWAWDRAAAVAAQEACGGPSPSAAARFLLESDVAQDRVDTMPGRDAYTLLWRAAGGCSGGSGVARAGFIPVPGAAVTAVREDAVVARVPLRALGLGEFTLGLAEAADEGGCAACRKRRRGGCDECRCPLCGDDSAPEHMLECEGCGAGAHWRCVGPCAVVHTRSGGTWRGEAGVSEEDFLALCGSDALQWFCGDCRPERGAVHEARLVTGKDRKGQRAYERSSHHWGAGLANAKGKPVEGVRAQRRVGAGSRGACPHRSVPHHHTITHACLPLRPPSPSSAHTIARTCLPSRHHALTPSHHRTIAQPLLALTTTLAFNRPPTLLTGPAQGLWRRARRRSRHVLVLARRRLQLRGALPPGGGHARQQRARRALRRRVRRLRGGRGQRRRPVVHGPRRQSPGGCAHTRGPPYSPLVRGVTPSPLLWVGRQPPHGQGGAGPGAARRQQGHAAQHRARPPRARAARAAARQAEAGGQIQPPGAPAVLRHTRVLPLRRAVQGARLRLGLCGWGRGRALLGVLCCCQVTRHRFAANPENPELRVVQFHLVRTDPDPAPWTDAGRQAVWPGDEMTIEAMRNGREKAGASVRKTAQYDIPEAWLDEQELKKRRAAASGGGRGGGGGQGAGDVAARMTALLQREVLVPEVRSRVLAQALLPLTVPAVATAQTRCSEQVGRDQGQVLRRAGPGTGP